MLAGEATEHARRRASVEGSIFDDRRRVAKWRLRKECDSMLAAKPSVGANAQRRGGKPF